MDEHYDVVVCGTGLKECIVAALLAGDGKKILHLDRNDYYGAESASLNITNLVHKFRGPEAKADAALGHNRDWNVDVIPKFVMGCGDLVQILRKTRVARYLQWGRVDGTFVYQFQKAAFGGFLGTKDRSVHKVPATVKEALGSSLMGILEQNRCRQFLQFIAQYDIMNSSTHGGFDRAKTPMKSVFDKYHLGASTIEFIGHAIALDPNAAYLMEPCGVTLDKLVLYVKSLFSYQTSPFIYPLYGIGSISEGFARVAAVNGTTYMLNKHVTSFRYDADGKVDGVETTEGTISCGSVVCDPSYCEPEDVPVVGRTVRGIYIIRNTPSETGGKDSCQIIIPHPQVGRQNDIYVAILGPKLNVCPQGYHLAVVATKVETNEPEKELESAVSLFEKEIVDKFVSVTPIRRPKSSVKKRNVFVSEDYDGESHFETATRDVFRMYFDMTGNTIDLSNIPEDVGE